MPTCISCTKNVDSYYDAPSPITNARVTLNSAEPDKVVTGYLCGKCYNRGNGDFGICNTCTATATAALPGTYHFHRKSEMKMDSRWTNSLRCTQHWDKNPNFKTVIGYSQKAEKIIGFIGDPVDKLHMGIEIETEIAPGNFSKTKDEIFDIMGENFVIMKTDGSLSQYGVEIVSAPAPFDVHKTAWEKLLTNLPKGVSSFTRNGSTSACGMHIHVSRAALQALDIGKSAYFIANALNKDLITDICGRYNASYCPIIQVAKENVGSYNSNGSRAAVNTINSATIEYRIFKGTLGPVMFMKNIEFVHALVKYVKVTDVDNLNKNTFGTFVALNAAIYPNLAKFLCFKGYIQGEKESEKLFENI